MKFIPQLSIEFILIPYKINPKILLSIVTLSNKSNIISLFSSFFKWLIISKFLSVLFG